MEQPMRLLVRQGWNDLLNLVFPPTCVNCGRAGSFLCPICQADSITYAAQPFSELMEFDGVISLAEHSGAIRESMHALKYEGVKGVAQPLAALLAPHISWTFDTIVPVPLHFKRLQERGYNQAEILAAALARELQCSMTPHMLRRDKFTNSQVGLNAHERQENVEDAFVVQEAVVPRVLLVDDVKTTGATLSACAKALREAGVTTIYGATVSVAVHS